MATTITIPSGSYGPGTFSVPETNLPSSARVIELRLDRTLWLDPSVSLAVSLECLENAVWVQCGRVTTVGGVVLNPVTGQPITTFTARFTMPDTGRNRVRGSLEITGGSLTTSGTITVS